MSQDDLYRFGNANSPRLERVRDDDVDCFERNGLLFVRANGRGISLLTEDGAARKPGWLWRIPKHTAMPLGLALNPDRPGHFSLCPISDMTVDSYRALLSQLALYCQRVSEKAMTVMNIELNNWETRFLLEAVRVLEKQWLQKAHSATDDDEQADYSSDLGQLEIVKGRLENQACAIFGPGVKDFARVPIP